jgi:ketosteroid isomerase-like protein
VYVEDPRWPGAARYEGRDAVPRCFQAYAEALGSDEDMAITVERVFDAGARQVVFARFQGRSASGIPHEHLWGYVVEVRARRIVYFRAYYEPEEALAAAGSGP